MTCAAAAAAAAGRWLRCIVRIIGFCTSPALMTHSPPQACYLDTGAMVSVVGQIATVHAPSPTRGVSNADFTGYSMTVSATAAD